MTETPTQRALLEAESRERSARRLLEIAPVGELTRSEINDALNSLEAFRRALKVADDALAQLAKDMWECECDAETDCYFCHVTNARAEIDRILSGEWTDRELKDLHDAEKCL